MLIPGNAQTKTQLRLAILQDFISTAQWYVLLPWSILFLQPIGFLVCCHAPNYVAERKWQLKTREIFFVWPACVHWDLKLRTMRLNNSGLNIWTIIIHNRKAINFQNNNSSISAYWLFRLVAIRFASLIVWLNSNQNCVCYFRWLRQCDANNSKKRARNLDLRCVH